MSTPSASSGDGVPAGGRPKRGPLARFGHGPGGTLTTRQKVVPLGALALLLVCLVYAMLPFTVAASLDCGPALLGSEPENPSPRLFVDRTDCRNAGGSRLALAGVLGLASLIIGVAGLVLPPDPEDA